MKNKVIYLDIDMDYFVYPIEKASVDNIRLYAKNEFTKIAVDPLIEKLKECGLQWNGNIHCFTNHKKSYTYWWMVKKQNCTVIHVDAHSDLYRNSNRDLRVLPNSEIGCHNYLWYAIRDGFVDEIYWVLPSSLKELVALDNAHRIVHQNLIYSCSLEKGILKIEVKCILGNGAEKLISIKICEAESLPHFNKNCEKTTIATSPEFIPEEADELIGELFSGFGLSDKVIKNIYEQHKDMLNKSNEEIVEAKKRLESII